MSKKMRTKPRKAIQRTIHVERERIGEGFFARVRDGRSVVVHATKTYETEGEAQAAAQGWAHNERLDRAEGWGF